jgi:protocatechuate 3,4-dioxygenase beta subunit
LGSTPAAATARIAGRILAADSGKPLRYASVTLLLQPSQTSHVTETDAYGRYEFAQLPAGRYSVRPGKDGFVFVAPDPFALGVGVNLSEGQIADRVDITMSRGSVITGRIADEFGDPVAGATVYAMRYVFTPSGQRELSGGPFGNYIMPAATNDRGEYRLFGLKPGSYYVFAGHDLSQPVAIGQRPGGVSDIASESGLIATYYPGTSNVAEAQPLRVELNRDAHASFALSPARMARIAGTVSDSQGRRAPGGWVSLRDATNTVGWLSQSNVEVTGDGTFEIANVAPGNYILDIRPTDSASRNASSGMEFATLPLTVTSDDVPNLEVVMRSGISVSGRVIFEGKSDIAQANLQISAVDEQEARNVVSYRGSGDGQVAPYGQFHISSAFGKVLFRT